MMVLLHGRNMRKEDLLPVAERFVAAGFRCLIPDLPAHGDSPLLTVTFGGSAFERRLPRKILADARQHFALPAEPAALWGMSMGGAFAVSAAKESPQTWDAAQQLRGQPVLSHLNPQEWAQGVHTPALVVHGTRDAFIPLAQGRKLYDALASPHKRWLTVDGGGHANVLGTAMPLYAEMGSWLLQAIPPASLADNR